jgi:hypothetical protein
MTGRPRHPRNWHLASGRQLWRLNKLGRLQLVDDAVRISCAEARAEIEAELEKLGEPQFPGTKVAARLAARGDSADERAARQP